MKIQTPGLIFIKSLAHLLFHSIIPLVVGVGGLLLVQGCSSAPTHEPKTTQEIRGDSDRFFNTMQEEEDAKKAK